ncbi:MAG: long-chain fatty acid--CoA ligase [Chloroflexota bacterium]
MVTYADRPWTQHYDEGVPASLAPYPDVPVQHFLVEAAKNTPDNTALVTSARLPSILGSLGRLHHDMTYAELNRASDALAAALVDMGLQKGERVAIVMPNCTAFVISFYAILKAGGVVAATNPTYPDGKMQFQINDCDARYVICLTMFYDQINRIRNSTKLEHVIVANIKEYLPGLAKFLFTLAKEKKEGHYVETLHGGDFWFQELLEKHDGQQSNVDVSTDDLALFQYTGGTTGVSKAAMSTHSALVANTLQCEAYLGGDGTDTFLGAIPLFHVFGMVAVLCFAVGTSAPIYMVPNARDITDLLDTIDAFKPTLFMGVPALYNAINKREDVQQGKYDLTSIRACVSGSAPLPPAVKREFERLSGGVIMEGFGMSEAPTATHCNPLKGENRVGSIGMPFPDMDIQIISLDDGETVMPVGEIGELVMAGPNLMRGYHGMPTETENALRERDGKKWLYTGDIARMDENGYFYIVDRKKDMALIGGFNVYPNGVEKALAEHPAVQEVAVAAIPHPEKEGQEALKAWIVFKEGQSATEKDLIEFVSNALAPYEVPRRYAFIDELPKTAVGKTLRRELVKMEADAAEKVPSS